MPVAAALIPAAVGLVSSGIKAISAAEQEKKDKQALARIHPAFYKIQDEYFGNERQAAGLAGQGLTSGAKNYYADMASRGLGTSIAGEIEGGGAPNDLNRIFAYYNDSARKLGAADSDAQINNIRYYHNVAKDLAGQKTIQWGVNEYKPAQDRMKQLTQNIMADKLNIHNAINAGIGSITAGFTGSQNSGLLTNLFKKGTNNNTDTGDPFSLNTPSGNSNQESPPVDLPDVSLGGNPPG